MQTSVKKIFSLFVICCFLCAMPANSVSLSISRENCLSPELKLSAPSLEQIFSKMCVNDIDFLKDEYIRLLKEDDPQRIEPLACLFRLKLERDEEKRAAVNDEFLDIANFLNGMDDNLLLLKFVKDLKLGKGDSSEAILKYIAHLPEVSQEVKLAVAKIDRFLKDKACVLEGHVHNIRPRLVTMGFVRQVKSGMQKILDANYEKYRIQIKEVNLGSNNVQEQLEKIESILKRIDNEDHSLLNIDQMMAMVLKECREEIKILGAKINILKNEVAKQLKDLLLTFDYEKAGEQQNRDLAAIAEDINKARKAGQINLGDKELMILKYIQKIIQCLGIVGGNYENLAEVEKFLDKALMAEKINLKNKDLKKLLENCIKKFKTDYPKIIVDFTYSYSQTELMANINDDFPELIEEIFSCARAGGAKKIAFNLQEHMGQIVITVSLEQGNWLDLDTYSLFVPFKSDKAGFTIPTLVFYRFRNTLGAVGGEISAAKDEVNHRVVFKITFPQAETNARVHLIIKDFKEELNKIENRLAEIEVKSEDKCKIIADFKTNLIQLESKSKEYLNAANGLPGMLDTIKEYGPEFLIKCAGFRDTFKVLLNQNEWQELDQNIEKAMRLLVDILVGSYRSTEMFKIEQSVERTVDLIKVREDQQGVNIEVTSSDALENVEGKLSTYKKDLSVVVEEFVLGFIKAGIENINIWLDLTISAQHGRMLDVCFSINQDELGDKRVQFNVSLLENIAQITGGKWDVKKNVEENRLKFIFSFPVTTDIQTLPVADEIQELFDDQTVACCFSGLAGARRNNSAQNLESIVGAKRFNLRFWMRISLWFLEQEYPELCKKLKKLFEQKEETGTDLTKTEAAIKRLVEAEVVPIFKEFLKMINFQSEPMLVKNREGKWIDVSASENGESPLRDEIKAHFLDANNAPLLYNLSNDQLMQKTLDLHIWNQVKEAIDSGLWNTVTIIATDPKKKPTYQELENFGTQWKKKEWESFQILNYYLDAHREDRIPFMMFAQQTLSMIDELTGKKEIDLEAIRVLAKIVEVEDLGMHAGRIAQEIVKSILKRLSDHALPKLDCPVGLTQSIEYSI
ncbi:MAG: hypothetical protein DRP78_00265 [Candidatus Omnitrophota bacterium]|nr:MAG: hypothetical protein DRP78_00265 [Candidatus Omnitrophota bacterium]